VLEKLRPFLVTYASARHVDDFPDDVREVIRSSGQRTNHINIGLFVLDANGKLLRHQTPFVRPPEFRFDPELQGRDFKRQINDLLEGLTLPANEGNPPIKLALPDVAGKEPLAGVRIYLTFGANRLNHYRTPTVEAVATTNAMRKALSYPERARKLSAEDLRPWLEQIYPPAIMDGKGGFERIDGTFTLCPAGREGDSRQALLEGDVRFVLDNNSRIGYDGRLAVVLDYSDKSADAMRARGVCACVFPKHNPQGQVVERIRMTAAIESRPR
jgi:hypothetical protein